MLPSRLTTLKPWIAGLLPAVLLTCLPQHLQAAETTPPATAQRVPWTSSAVTGSPSPPLPWVAERVFPELTFTHCLDLTFIPGTDRLLVVEQAGRILSFPNRNDVAAADLAANLAEEIPGVKQVYALAFHPDFLQNRYCYVCCIKEAGQEDGTQVVRLELTDSDPPVIDPASETTIITWLSGGHNGCCLKFGLDGYLYISTGDGTGPNPPDIKKTGQDVSDLLSSILRIDVDHTENGRNYRIPSDNPFVGHEDAREEVWAYGLRNPWRMSVDRRTGDLWVGDVGWELWEMLNRVERGGNYGWAVTEGAQSTNPEWPRGPTPILPPTITHPHSESSSITDGLTYYGHRLPELHGTHVYADYDTGRFWGFRFENGEVIDHRELADTTHRVVGFGEDHHGELLFLDHVAGTIHRLIPNPQPDLSRDFPRKLSDTGLFSSLSPLRPAAGVVPYGINAEPWADHAVTERLLAVPGDETVTPTAAAWTAPTDTVLVRTLSLDLIQGDPDSRRRVETQLLHFDGRQWQPYTYQWNDAQTDAVLVDDQGLDQEFRVADEDAPDGLRKQAWHFSGRAECQRCHNNWSGPPLGFNTAQLNRPQPGHSNEVSQLDAWADSGLLAASIPDSQRPQLTDPGDETADLEQRARAWLHTNCAHCHRRHAGGAVLSHMHFDLPLDQTNMLGARPSQGTFGIPAATVIDPGHPLRSVLFYRISKLGGGRMPRLGSSEVDRAGTALIHDWIRRLPHDTSSRPRPPTVDDVVAELSSAPKTSAVIDRLLSSTTGALTLMRAVESDQLDASLRAAVIETASASDHSTVRDLFERFLPAGRRTKRLGNAVRPEQILSLDGNADRGRQLFFDAEGVSCRNCHRIGDQGKAVGPDLTKAAGQRTQAQLLDSILEPSRQIDPEYTTWLAETRQGQLVSGLMVEKTGDEVVLRNAENDLRRLPLAEIEQLLPQQQSLMPDLLFRDMTAQQVADLVAFLSSLRETTTP